MTKFVDSANVRKRYSFSDTTLWRKVKNKHFPKPVKLPGSNERRWNEKKLDEYDEALEAGVK